MAPFFRRRWLRFSLRGLFLAITLAAVYLGWNVSVVRQRRALLASLPEQRHVIRFTNHRERLWPTREQDAFQKYFVRRVNPALERVRYQRYEPSAPYRLPRVRQWLGDELKLFIAYHPGPDPQRTLRVFPEAIVVITEEPWEEPEDNW